MNIGSIACYNHQVSSTIRAIPAQFRQGQTCTILANSATIVSSCQTQITKTHESELNTSELNWKNLQVYLPKTLHNNSSVLLNNLTTFYLANSKETNYRSSRSYHCKHCHWCTIQPKQLVLHLFDNLSPHHCPLLRWYHEEHRLVSRTPVWLNKNSMQCLALPYNTQIHTCNQRNNFQTKKLLQRDSNTLIFISIRVQATKKQIVQK